MSAYRPPASQLRLAGVLILAAPATFIMTLMHGATTLLNMKRPPEHASVEQAVAAVAPFRGAWAVSWILQVLSMLLLAAGLIAVFRILTKTKARPVAIIGTPAAIGVLASWTFLAYLNIGLLADVAHLPPFVAEQRVSPFGGLIGSIPFQTAAGVLSGVSATAANAGLFVSGLLRRTGLVLGILNGLFLLAYIAVQLGLIAVGLPPIFPMVLLVPLGIGLMRRALLVGQPVGEEGGRLRVGEAAFPG